MTKIIKESSENNIILDKTEINSSILSSGVFSSDGIYIKKYTPQKEDSNIYIAKLKKDEAEYKGMLNDKFQREGYGLELYNNGDKYFGQYESDLRNDNGIYFFNSVKNEENKNEKIECYLGQWKNNLKDKYGIYIWMDEPENNYEYENSNFDAYIGEFEEEKYIRGTYLTKLNKEYFIYHGNFNKEGKKNDNNAYFYSSKIYCKFNEDGSINEIIEEHNLNLNEEELFDEKKKMKYFRNIILEGDYFTKIYNKYKKIKDKIEKLEDINQILEEEEKIGEINKILNKYNKNNIYYNIEENFFGRDI